MAASTWEVPVFVVASIALVLTIGLGTHFYRHICRGSKNSSNDSKTCNKLNVVATIVFTCFVICSIGLWIFVLLTIMDMAHESLELPWALGWFIGLFATLVLFIIRLDMMAPIGANAAIQAHKRKISLVSWLKSP